MDIRDYDNYQKLDLDCWVVGSVFEDLVEELLGLIYQRRPANARVQLHMLLSNLCVAHQADPDRCVSIVRDPAFYRPNNLPVRYNPVGATGETLTTLVNWLRDHDWIGFKAGFRALGGHKKGKISRIWPLAPLLTQFERIGDSLAVAPHSEAEVIELRGKKPPKLPYNERPRWDNRKGPLLDYQETADTSRMRTRLRLINAWFQENWIDLKVTEEELSKLGEKYDGGRAPLDPNRFWLKRVFNNGSFDEGGRFYGAWWLEVPNKDFPWRKEITINGNSTIELDYSGMHLEMLYARTDQHMPEEPYAHPEFDSTDKNQRDCLKRMVNAVINAECVGDSIGVVKGKLQEYGIDVTSTPEKILQDIKELHSPVAEWFHSGEGLRLQRLDSDLIERVLLEAMQLHIVCLPVHDSLIVDLKHGETVLGMMKHFFAEMFGRVPSVKFDDDIEFVEGFDPQTMELREGCITYESHLAAWLKYTKTPNDGYLEREARYKKRFLERHKALLDEFIQH